MLPKNKCGAISSLLTVKEFKNEIKNCKKTMQYWLTFINNIIDKYTDQIFYT